MGTAIAALDSWQRLHFNNMLLDFQLARSFHRPQVSDLPGADQLILTPGPRDSEPALLRQFDEVAANKVLLELRTLFTLAR